MHKTARKGQNNCIMKTKRTSNKKVMINADIGTLIDDIVPRHLSTPHSS